MTSYLVRSKAYIFLLLLWPLAAMAQDFPPRPNTHVVDYTGSTLSTEEINALESKVRGFEDSTSIQFAIVIMQSIGDNDISEYAAKLGNAWGVGMEGKNNGIVVLMAMDVRKIGIQIGRGLEGAATDGLTGTIIRREMVPYFKQGNYYAGIDNGVTTLMNITHGEFKADAYMKGGKPPFFLFALIIFIVIIIFVSRVGQVNRYARRNNLGFWAAWALLNAASNRSRGSWGGFSGGSGGFGGGGGWGGFGGGSFGGGGASGSW